MLLEEPFLLPNFGELTLFLLAWRFGAWIQTTATEERHRAEEINLAGASPIAGEYRLYYITRCRPPFRRKSGLAARRRAAWWASCRLQGVGGGG